MPTFVTPDDLKHEQDPTMVRCPHCAQWMKVPLTNTPVADWPPPKGAPGAVRVYDDPEADRSPGDYVDE